MMAMATMQESGAPRIEVPGDERPGVSPQGAQRSSQPLALAVGALIVALIAVGSFLALSSGTHTRVGANSEDLPVIRADARPFKVSPEEPGGMDVPNRDKLVYSRLKGVAGAPEVERLLPAAETPLPLPAPPAPPTAATATATAPAATPQLAAPSLATHSPVTEPHDPPGQTAVLPSPAAPAEAASPAAPAVAAVTTAAPAPRPAPRPAATAGAAPRIETKPEVVAAAPTRPEAVTPAAVTTKAAGKPNYLVQLGAMSSADAAKAQWQKLMSGNRDLLGGLQPSIAEANLADRRLYRLRAGPVDAPEKAQALCKALSGRSVGCVVVSTGG